MAACSSTKSASAGAPWQQRLFGKQLMRCSKQQYVKTCDALTDEASCDIVGVYFSFINAGATCDDFTKQLVKLHESVNNISETENGDAKKAIRKRLEVVHVVLWSNVEVLNLDETFKNHVADLPWLAIPNHDYERKVPYSFFVFCSSFSADGFPFISQTYLSMRIIVSLTGKEQKAKTSMTSLLVVKKCSKKWKNVSFLLWRLLVLQ